MNLKANIVVTPVRIPSKLVFYQQARFSNFIECIDGTHVGIITPTSDENAYLKGFHSTYVQAVCDHDGK